MERFFLNIYSYFNKNRPVLFICFAACLIVPAFFASRLKFEEDISKVLPKDKKIAKLNEVFQNSRFLDKLVVMVSLKDSSTTDVDSLAAFAGQLVPSVKEALPAYISKINDKVDDEVALRMFTVIRERLPVYLTEKDYIAIDSLIAPGTVKTSLQQNFRTLTSPSGMILKEMISNDPVGISFIGLKKLQQLQYDENFELYNNYVVTRDHKTLLLFITPAFPPSNTGENKILLNGLDSIIDKLNSGSFKNIEAAYFGASAVSAGNALQLRKDSIYTQGVTVLFIVIFLGLYFRRKRAPF
ncbi:MAG: glycerol acyltransferase, partial [Chitinophagaceae bacterium]|nr:glycerol acyltransferase [Chitinophagaceae bacterium]